MLLEFTFIVVVFLAVVIVFYRQAIEQYNILQIEASQVSELSKLLGERTPVVVRNVGTPKLFLPELLKTNKRLQQFPIGNQMTLGSYIAKPTTQVSLTKKAAILLGKESGLSVWGDHTWFPKCFQYPILQQLHSFSTEAHLGEVGLRKTTGIVTFLYPTAGALEVTLLTEQQGKYLPTNWRGRFPETFTVQDTPLVGEIKYITVKLRPGTILCIPTHWYASIRVVDKAAPALWAKFTLDNPISSVASAMEGSFE
jgi:hypothetical protein